MQFGAHKAHLWVSINEPWNPLLENLFKVIKRRILGQIHTNISLGEIIG